MKIVIVPRSTRRSPRRTTIPEWEKDIRETFAKRWVAKAQGGWYYKAGGAWKQK